MALLLSLFFSEAEKKQCISLQYQCVVSVRFICDELSKRKEKVL